MIPTDSSKALTEAIEAAGEGWSVVKWIDAVGVGQDWQEISHVERQELSHMIVVSFGKIIAKSSHVIVLAPHVTSQVGGQEECQVCGQMNIPLRAIVEVSKVEKLTQVYP